MNTLLKTPLFLLLFTVYSIYSQKQYTIRTVAFYNVENLFDTINDTSKKDELSPMMEIKNNRSEIYWDKIDNISDVIIQLGSKKANNSPTLLGLAEIENGAVLQDLVKSNKLRKKNYGIIHFDSPDERGIDVALLYNPKYFKPIHYEVFNPNIYTEKVKVKTRDILWVNGYLDSEEINVIVNHWPSRRGGESKTRHLREKAAYKVTQIVEKIRENDTDAKIIILGDFNDDPTNSSFKTVLNTKKDIDNLQENDIYNPYENMFKKGLNTLVYRDNINLFDQILISTPLLNLDKKNKDFSTYKMFKSAIFNKPFLTHRKGPYKGYPFRSFSKGKYTDGYSDHYPVYMYLIKEKK